MGAIVQIAGQENPKLTRGEIDAVPANQRDDGIAKKATWASETGLGGAATSMILSQGKVLPNVSPHSFET